MNNNFCLNCGSKITVDSRFCSNCGCAIQKHFEGNEEGNVEVYDDTPFNKVSSMILKTTESLRKNNNIKQLGAITIDVDKKFFYVSGAKRIKSKDSKTIKFARGTAAIFSVGLTYLGEKSYLAAKKAIEGKDWINFSDLKGYERNIQNNRKYSGNSGRVKITNGLWIGKSEGKSKNVTEYASIILKINSLDNPIIEIPIIEKELSGKSFEKATDYFKQTEAALEFILENK